MELKPTHQHRWCLQVPEGRTEPAASARSVSTGMGKGYQQRGAPSTLGLVATVQQAVPKLGLRPEMWSKPTESVLSLTFTCGEQHRWCRKINERASGANTPVLCVLDGPPDALLTDTNGLRPYLSTGRAKHHCIALRGETFKHALSPQLFSSIDFMNEATLALKSGWCLHTKKELRLRSGRCRRVSRSCCH